MSSPILTPPSKVTDLDDEIQALHAMLMQESDRIMPVLRSWFPAGFGHVDCEDFVKMLDTLEVPASHAVATRLFDCKLANRRGVASANDLFRFILSGSSPLLTQATQEASRPPTLAPTPNFMSYHDPASLRQNPPTSSPSSLPQAKGSRRQPNKSEPHARAGASAASSDLRRLPSQSSHGAKNSSLLVTKGERQRADRSEAAGRGLKDRPLRTERERMGEQPSRPRGEAIKSGARASLEEGEDARPSAGVAMAIEAADDAYAACVAQRDQEARRAAAARAARSSHPGREELEDAAPITGSVGRQVESQRGSGAMYSFSQARRALTPVEAKHSFSPGPGAYSVVSTFDVPLDPYSSPSPSGLTSRWHCQSPVMLSQARSAMPPLPNREAGSCDGGKLPPIEADEVPSAAAVRTALETLLLAMCQSTSKLSQLFAEWDYTGRRRVDRSELASGLTSIGVSSDEGALDEVFALLGGPNGDINLVELYRLVHTVELPNEAAVPAPCTPPRAPSTITLPVCRDEGSMARNLRKPKSAPGVANRSRTHTDRGDMFANSRCCELLERKHANAKEMLCAALIKHRPRIIELIRVEKVEKKHFRACIREFGLQASRQDVDALFESWDKDSRGHLPLQGLDRILRKGGHVDRLQPRRRRGVITQRELAGLEAEPAMVREQAPVTPVKQSKWASAVARGKLIGRLKLATLNSKDGPGRTVIQPERDKLQAAVRDPDVSDALMTLLSNWDSDFRGDGTVGKKDLRRALPVVLKPGFRLDRHVSDALFETWSEGRARMDLAELDRKLHASAPTRRPGRNRRSKVLSGQALFQDQDRSIAEQLRDALVANSARVSDLFREWDSDNDGLVSKEEFRMALPMLGLFATRGDADHLFDSFDSDGSGSITFLELNRMLRRDVRHERTTPTKLRARGGKVPIADVSKLRASVSQAMLCMCLAPAGPDKKEFDYLAGLTPPRMRAVDGAEPSLQGAVKEEDVEQPPQNMVESDDNASRA